MPSPPQLIEVPCPRCGSFNSRRIITGRDRLHNLPGTYYASRCQGCGLWFQSPRVDPRDIPSLYPPEYAPHLEPPQSAELRPDDAWYLRRHLGYEQLGERHAPGAWRRFLARWRANVAMEPHFVEGGRVLEIGCATGWRLLHLRDLGWSRLEGIEIVQAAADVARSYGLTIHSMPVEAALGLYDDQSIDVVITGMVIEHLVNPFEIIRRLADKLKPGGELLFSTVIRNSIDARIWKTWWRNLDLPRHMVWFTTSDIREMISPWFTDVEITHQAAVVDIVGSARFRQAEKRVRFDSVITRLGEHRMGGVAMLLALAHQTSRVSVRARRRS